jgi:t-SNARE complex subunit (syntaxin)
MADDFEQEYDDAGWARFKAQAATRWPELTEAEIEASRNDEELFVALLQHRYALTRGDAVEQLTEVQALALD